MIPDLAARAHDHSYRVDPIIRTLLDTDFYKFLMLQMIWKLRPEVHATFGLHNRSTSIRLADCIDEKDLIAQLDHARTLRFRRNELIWLAGNSFYGRAQMFEPGFLDYLAAFRLPPYQLSRRGGEFELRFEGFWRETTMWEVPTLAILNELRARGALTKMGRFELDILYARAKAKLWGKVERLRRLAQDGPLRLSDFGTRRRHGFLWQRWCVEALREGIGESLIGTSNVKHAMDLGLEAIGTNAHELPMVYAALANSDDELRAAPYNVLADWAQLYDGNLRVLLPDTFGTAQFLRNAPDWAADWTGARPDSKPPVEAANELIGWWTGRGRDPSGKLIVLSDGMTIDSIESSTRQLRGRAETSIGWGTDLTNDFEACAPNGSSVDLTPPALVCKVIEVEGRPAVKLSDNPAKFLGPPDEIARYRRVFGYEAGTAGSA